MSKNFKRVAGKLFGGALLAGSMIGFGASQANADLLIDLRAATGDAKNVTVTALDAPITLNVYAVATGTDAVATNDGLVYAFYSVVLTQGSLKGALSDVTLPAVFNPSVGGQPGGKKVDGDGYQYISGTDPAAPVNNDYVMAKSTAAEMVTLNADANGLLIGTLTFTPKAGGANGNTASIDLGLRGRGTTVPFNWQEDGVNKKNYPGSTATQNGVVTKGAPVTITYSTGGPVETIGMWWKTGSAANHKVNVKANDKGYISDVYTLGQASSASDVEVSVTGTGPAGDKVALLWLNGDDNAKAALKAKLATFGATIVDSSNATGEFNVAQQWYSQVGGRAFDWMVTVPNSAAAGDMLQWDFGTTGVSLAKVAMVPEPASLTMLGLGAAGLLLARRRRA